MKPFDNIDCRKAVQYAIDKVSVQTAVGGPTPVATSATTMLPPTVTGYAKFDLYTDDRATSGDVAKAKEELTKPAASRTASTPTSPRAPTGRRDGRGHRDRRPR